MPPPPRDRIPTPAHAMRVASVGEQSPANGNDDQSHDGDRPPHVPRTAAQIMVAAALEAKAAAEHAAGMAGEAMGAALAAERTAKATGAKTDALEVAVSRLSVEVRQLADGVGAKRTYSGQLKISLPPPPTDPIPDVQVNTIRTLTGTHFEMDTEAHDKLVRDIAELKLAAEVSRAREQGMRDAVLDQEAATEKTEKAQKRFREWATFFVLIAGALLAVGGWWVRSLVQQPAPVPPDQHVAAPPAH